MPRFIFYTDLHLWDKAPVNRVDDYGECVQNKLQDVYNFAAKWDVDAVLFGGDFCNRPRLFDYTMITNAARTVNGCFSGDRQISTYAIIGQHDLVGYRVENYDQSTLHFVEAFSSAWHTITTPIKFGDVTVHPAHVNKDPRTVKPTGQGINVLISHWLLHPDANVPFSTTPISEMVDKGWDLVLSGDLHNGFDPIMIGKTTFANPGAIARREIGDCRTIRCFLVEIDKGIHVSSLILPSQKSPDEIWRDQTVTSFLSDTKEDARSNIGDGYNGRFVDSLQQFAVERQDVWSQIEDAAKPVLSESAFSYLMSVKK